MSVLFPSVLPSCSFAKTKDSLSLSLLRRGPFIQDPVNLVRVPCIGPVHEYACMHAVCGVPCQPFRRHLQAAGLRDLNLSVTPRSLMLMKVDLTWVKLRVKRSRSGRVVPGSSWLEQRHYTTCSITGWMYHSHVHESDCV